jgi:hypothetical protein
VSVPWTDLEGRPVVLQELMTPGVRYERDGGELCRRGLYVDLPAWGRHVLEVNPPPP